MKLNKTAVHELEKCYAIAPLHYQNKEHILVAAEKVNKCLLFDLDGNLEDTIWDEPGGTMSMVQVPGSDGWFLATHQFYSPNDGAKAHIVLVRPSEAGWTVTNISDLPFCHRFSILKGKDQNYLIACTIKGAHEYKEDWRTPGAIYVAELPADIENYNENHQIVWTKLLDGLFHNHGYATDTENGSEYALVGTDNGVFKAVPPEKKGETWTLAQLTREEASDMVAVDFDQDGQKELITIAPFHGDHIKIYHKNGTGVYENVWECPFTTEMAHAIWPVDDRTVLIGHRKGERRTMAFYYKDGYQVEVLEEHTGAANLFSFVKDGKIRVVATNREINEIAFYDLEK